MPYQYKREPLTADEANCLANACKTHEEKLVIWTLLDTGLRVSEFANLKRDNLDWQQHRLRVYGIGRFFATLRMTVLDGDSVKCTNVLWSDLVAARDDPDYG